MAGRQVRLRTTTRLFLFCQTIEPGLSQDCCGLMFDYSSLEEIWIGAAPKAHWIAENEIAESVLIQLPPLDQLIRFSQNIGHFDHVKMANIGAHHGMELNPARVDVGAKGPRSNWIVDLAAEVEMFGEQIPDVLRPCDATSHIIVHGFDSAQQMAQR